MFSLCFIIVWQKCSKALLIYWKDIWPTYGFLHHHSVVTAWDTWQIQSFLRKLYKPLFAANSHAAAFWVDEIHSRHESLVEKALHYCAERLRVHFPVSTAVFLGEMRHDFTWRFRSMFSLSIIHTSPLRRASWARCSFALQSPSLNFLGAPFYSVWWGQLTHYSSLQLDLIIFKMHNTKQWL